MPDKSINDLHILLTEQNGDIKVLLEKYENFEKWRIKHENDDEVTHERLHKRISDMKIVSTGMSIVSVIVGLFTGMKIK